MPAELMMHADRWPPNMRQRVLAGKADCKVMSGDYVESRATYPVAYGPQLHDWPVPLSIWTRNQGPWVLSLPVRDRARRILTRDEVRRCKAQAAPLTVDTARAAELGDAWPLER